jgi:hypothetical protein
MSIVSRLKSLLQPDNPLSLSSKYQLDRVDRQYIDTQITSIQSLMVQGQLRGQLGSWFRTLSPLQPGDAVCSGPAEANESEGVATLRSCTLATPDAVASAGRVLGINTVAAPSGAMVFIAMGGVLGRAIHGLAVGSQGPVVLASDGRAQKVTAYATGDVPIGHVDGYGNLTLQPGPAVEATGGGGGGGSGSIFVKDPVTVVAVGTTTLPTGLATTLNGVLCNDTSMRVLFTDLSDGTKNLIYNPRAGAWVRASDCDASADVLPGIGGQILPGGTRYGGGTWSLATVGSITLGTTLLSFNLKDFVNTAGALDKLAGMNASNLGEMTKVQDRHVDNNSISPGKLASGGSGNNGLFLGVAAGLFALQALPASPVSGLKEDATAVTARASVQGSWLDVFDTGSAVQMRPHARVPRARVRACADTNITNSISSTFQGLTLLANEAIYKGAQTTPSENGVYRVATVSAGTATLVKLSELDAVITSTGLYVQICEGTYAGTIRKFVNTGTGSLAAAPLMPAISPSYFSFDKVYVEDFVIPGDNISRTAGNWAPILARAYAGAFYGSAETWYANPITYRHTARHNCWHTGYICGNHIAYGLGGLLGVGPRISFEGAAVAGFYGVGLGGYTDAAGNVWDSGIRGGLHLRGLNCVFSSGSSDLQFGAMSVGSTHIDHCVFAQCFGDGVIIDSTLGAVGSNCNGWSISHTAVQTAGACGYVLNGGDCNNGLMQDSRSSNHAQRDLTAAEYEPIGVTAFPGRDHGVLNTCFLGSTFIGCEFSSGHKGAIWDRGSFSRYIGMYTEGGTVSDIVGSNIFAGNIALRGTYLAETGVSVTFANSGSADTVTRATGSWLTTLKAQAGDTVAFTGSVSNNVTGVLASVTATVLTFTSATPLTNEGPVTVAVVGSNPLARTTVANPAPTTKIPLLKVLNSNVWAMSGLVCDDPIALTGRIAIGDNGLISRGPPGSSSGTSWNIQQGTGGNLNTISCGYGTLSAGVESQETLPTHPTIGAGRRIFRKAPLFGDPAVAVAEIWYTTDATAHPSTGVPDSSPTTAISGAKPVGSMWFCEPGGPRLARIVLTNSNSPSYNLTWGAIANPSAPRVTLTRSTQTITWAQGGKRVIAASASATPIVITWGAGGSGAAAALKGDQIIIEVQPQSGVGGTVTMTNGGAGGTGVQPDKVLAINTEYRVVGSYDGTDWTFQAWACV